MKTNENQWKPIKSMEINDFNALIDIFRNTSWLKCHAIRRIECRNLAKSIGNGFPMKKYVGAMLRKPSIFQLVTEIGSFEKIMSLQKKTLNLL